MSQTKKDYYLVTLIGFLVGWLALPVLGNFGLVLSAGSVIASVAGFSLLAPIALWVLKFLARFWKVFEQFGKFAAVGTLNTLIDLGILNLAIYITGVTQGWTFSGFKAISFLCAATNSYFWNKFWTFQSRMPVAAAEYIRFLLFTLIGTLINVGVASLVVNVIGAPSGTDPKMWANIGALIAVAISFMVNFLNYRFIVFREKKSSDAIPPSQAVNQSNESR